MNSGERCKHATVVSGCLQNESTLDVYIGLNDIASKHSRVQLDGSPVSYSNWAAGMSSLTTSAKSSSTYATNLALVFMIVFAIHGEIWWHKRGRNGQTGHAL